MWATAPYLHNNSVGRAPVDADGKIDPKAITVEGRLALFEDAINQLLKPRPRKPMIKVTSADSSLLPACRGSRARSRRWSPPRPSRPSKRRSTTSSPNCSRRSSPRKKSKPKQLRRSRTFRSRFKSELDKLHSLEDLAKSKLELVAKLKGQIEALIDEKLKGKPKVADLFANFMPSWRHPFRLDWTA